MRETSCGVAGEDRNLATTECAPFTEELMKRLSDAASRLNDVASRIEEHGNRLYGPRPEAGCGSDGNDAKRSEPQGIVDYLYMALASVDDAIVRTASAHARISRV